MARIAPLRIHTEAQVMRLRDERNIGGDSITDNGTRQALTLGASAWWSMHTYHQASFRAACDDLHRLGLGAICVRLAAKMDVRGIENFLDRLVPANAAALDEMVWAYSRFVGTWHDEVEAA